MFCFISIVTFSLLFTEPDDDDDEEENDSDSDSELESNHDLVS